MPSGVNGQEDSWQEQRDQESEEDGIRLASLVGVEQDPVEVTGDDDGAVEATISHLTAFAWPWSTRLLLCRRRWLRGKDACAADVGGRAGK